MVAKEWDTSYNDWKTTVFKTLETRDMDDIAQAQFKKLTKMSRDLRVISNFRVLFIFLKNKYNLMNKGEKLGYS